MTTSFEYAFQDPTDPLIVDPFEYREDGEYALAIRVLPPAMATAAAERMLEVRTAILRQAGAPKEVLDRYDPVTESVSQIGYIARSGHTTHYLSASIGRTEHIEKLAEKDDEGMPIYGAPSVLEADSEIDKDLPIDVQHYLRKQIAERHAKERTVEKELQTIGLAKLSIEEEGDVRIDALDVHPDYARQSIGSLLLYKGFGIFGNHVGVHPRPEEPETQFYGVHGDPNEWAPLLVQAKAHRLDTQLPNMLERLGMGHDGYEYVGELRVVQEQLQERLIGRGLIQAPESENS